MVPVAMGSSDAVFPLSESSDFLAPSSVFIGFVNSYDTSKFLLIRQVSKTTTRKKETILRYKKNVK